MSLNIPSLVTDRILAYATAAGRENVVAGTDCGLDGRVHSRLPGQSFERWPKVRGLQAQRATQRPENYLVFIQGKVVS
jgi:5-methyltetrahydropteroyltriglutamate--homocysteine methyltransferase